MNKIKKNPSKNGNRRNNKGQFTEGNNEGGRTKGSGLNLTSLLKKKLESVDKKDKKEFSKKFIDKLVNKALNDDDIQAMKLIMNYVDGLPVQFVEGNLNLKSNYDEEQIKAIAKRIRSNGGASSEKTPD